MKRPTAVYLRTIRPLLFASLLACLATATGFALGDPAYVERNAIEGGLPLAHDGKLAAVYVDDGDHWGVVRAVGDLQADFERVTGKQPKIVHDAAELGKHAVIVGAIGHSALVDRLIADGKIDISEIEGQWDGYHIELVANPIADVEQALVIAGSDKRGAIFGVYDLSEQMGVSPWYWWADVPTEKADTLFVKAGTRIQDAPKVKYRGIFLNDEAPALTGWVQENYGDYNSEFYVHVFELLLRLKANFLWPAMWNNAFADDDPQNMILADKYGIVMSTSHHEPMMRADKEWNRYGEGPWDYARNPERLYDFWMDGVERNKPYESIYTLGMRGQQDTPMSETEDVELLEKIVADQREILDDVFEDRELEEIPQVWALYKEVQNYYEKGMRVPDDVILLWCDDNWGNIRRLPTPEERKRPGGAGVYYHFDYVGGPRSYRWINTIQNAKIWEQMNLASAYDANKIWLTNVGDLKPMEYPIEFFLDIAWDIEDWPKERLPEYGRLFAAREFGEKHAAEIQTLLEGYTRHNGRRKPELQDASTYSLFNYDEADRIEAELVDLTQRAESIYEKLDRKYKDAFYQLVLYPAKASGVITKMYIAQARNHLYASQGRATTNEWAQRVTDLFEMNATLADRYHTDVADGKWNHMMSQPRIGYTHWNNPPADTMPPIMLNRPTEVADMGVAVEGMRQAWPQDGARYSLPTFHRYGQQELEIEIFNKGTVPFEFTATVSEPWIVLSEESGEVKSERTVTVSVDWSKAPEGSTNGNVSITGTGWGSASIAVSAIKPAETDLQGFIEADGYVSIEAASYSDKRDVDGYSWEEIPLLGRTRSSISVFPITDRSFEDPSSAPYVEYDLTLFDGGELTVNTLWAPTWPIVPGRGLRFAIAFDDKEPRVIDILEDFDQGTWQESVRNGVHHTQSKHSLQTGGHHTLRIYMVDSAATLQKIIIDTGGLKSSYLGPQESLNASELN